MPNNEQKFHRSNHKAWSKKCKKKEAISKIIPFFKNILIEIRRVTIWEIKVHSDTAISVLQFYKPKNQISIFFLGKKNVTP